MGVRQISFLGTGRYKQTLYSIDGIEVQTAYVAEAIARATDPLEIFVFATEQAWAAHGEGLASALLAAGAPAPARVPIPDGHDAGEQWSLFERLLGSLDADGIEQVVLDVTHGWRAQPFIAAAVLAYHRATARAPLPIRALYGAFTEGAPRSAIWDLTAFLDVVDWGHGLRSLIQTGRAVDVVEAARPVARERGRSWAESGRRGPQPRLSAFVTALDAFSADLTTVRTGALVGPDGTAARLVEAIASVQEEVRASLPPLFPALERLASFARPLTVDSLGGPSGDAVLAALARLYLDLERPLEAITVAREARVSRFAEPFGRQPGTPKRTVDAEAFLRARTEAEARWFQGDPDARALADVRNTLDHAAFQGQPLPASAVRAQVRRQVDALGEAPAAAPERPTETIFVNLSHHPSDRWSPEQRRAALALASCIEDVPFPEVDPECEDISALLEVVLSQIPAGCCCAMVQGESVLQHALVVRLQGMGVACFAATTAREVSEREGQKISVFRFVRFRLYPQGA